MTRVLIAGIVAGVISIATGPRFIDFLRRKELGQQIREEGPERHVAKKGTPTAGGILILVAATIAFVALSKYELTGLTVLFVTLACGAIGFADDFIKFTHKRSLGLSGRWKILLLACVAAITGYLAHRAGLSHLTSVLIPGTGYRLPLGPLWYVFIFLVIAGAANGVNLCDGVDGLAAGTAIISLFTFTTMAVLTFIRSARTPSLRSPDKLDLAIAGAALIGAAVGFLWYNAFPAEVFMGDTGAMALGGAMAGFAIMMKAELLLLFIGGVYLLEALSVIIQVFTFKYLGRRVFLMAPIHHHFEMKAWSETKIMVRFWITAGVLCSVGFALFYLYYLPPRV
ncbi:MAG: phospho-N-acetylmuramoyl-pentapeptide-transferase [Chloroflexi bacterium]|nr:MAG: phospho-N-acetylmuramoyl-pentapeptide-transferase [Chloroflexota bacterium]